MSEISRRKILHGAGIALGLPMLESLTPRGASRARAGADPVRYLNMYLPNGFYHWKIGNVNLTKPGETRAHTLSGALTKIAHHRENFTIIRGLDAMISGPGVHNSVSCYYLTGMPQVGGCPVAKVAISVDQVAAAAIGNRTPDLPSLQVGTWGPSFLKGMQGDSLCNPDYTNKISWDKNGNPINPTTDPLELFNRLVSAPGAPRKTGPGLAIDRSVLDYLVSDVQSLSTKLNAPDRVKVDDYLEQVRATEKKVTGMISTGQGEINACKSGMTPPTATPKSFDDYLHIMSDLIVLALACDKTRILTYHLGIEIGGPDFRPTLNFKVPGGEYNGQLHHSWTHTPGEYWNTLGGEPARQAVMLEIENFYTRHVAYLLDGMAKINEGSGTLLDNSMVVFGSGMQYDHDNTNLYTIVAGKGGGALHPGRHIMVNRGTPLPNLHVTMLNKLGIPATKFGKSTGSLNSFNL